MIRKRNDERGHERGQGHYSGEKNKVNFDRRDHYLRPSAGGVHDIEAQSDRIGETKAGFFNKYPKK